MAQKILRTLALLSCLCALCAAAGCVRVPQRRTATVLADTALQTALQALSPAIEQKTGVAVTFVFADTDTLAADVRGGHGGDLAALAGISDTPQGSYTYGAPAALTLMQEHLADNYANLTMDGDGRVYTLIKPLTSKNYAAAQAVADYLISKEGRDALSTYGFTI